MKLKEGFVLRTISGQTVVLPTGGDLDLSMMIKLNDTGRFLWERLEKGAEVEELVEDMLKEYDVSKEKATEFVEQFVQTVKENGFLA
ncbi:MAG: PqqD family protein [Lachnospiraceae bacterium]|nr:PqqD family protein [Lachnospiraceae bacterium]